MMAPRPPSEPFWLHEIKYDGVRLIARKDGGRIRLYDRLGADVTQRFPLIVEAMARLPSCTIDGEAVVDDEAVFHHSIRCGVASPMTVRFSAPST